MTAEQLQAIYREVARGRDVRLVALPGGETYPPALAVDVILGASFKRYHFELEGPSAGSNT